MDTPLSSRPNKEGPESKMVPAAFSASHFVVKTSCRGYDDRGERASGGDRTDGVGAGYLAATAITADERRRRHGSIRSECFVDCLALASDQIDAIRLQPSWRRAAHRRSRRSHLTRQARLELERCRASQRYLGTRRRSSSANISLRSARRHGSGCQGALACDFVEGVTGLGVNGILS